MKKTLTPDLCLLQFLCFFPFLLKIEEDHFVSSFFSLFLSWDMKLGNNPSSIICSWFILFPAWVSSPLSLSLVTSRKELLERRSIWLFYFSCFYQYYHCLSCSFILQLINWTVIKNGRKRESKTAKPSTARIQTCFIEYPRSASSFVCRTQIRDGCLWKHWSSWAHDESSTVCFDGQTHDFGNEWNGNRAARTDSTTASVWVFFFL